MGLNCSVVIRTGIYLVFTIYQLVRFRIFVVCRVLLSQTSKQTNKQTNKQIKSKIPEALPRITLGALGTGRLGDFKDHLD